MITDIHQLDLQKTYTYADYLTWRFKERVELIKGRIFKMSPAPNVTHQRISSFLHQHIANFLEKYPCEVFHAPFDVRLPSLQQEVVHTVVQPDLVIICDSAKLDEQGCIGAPDLVIEILSPGNTKREMKDKFELYQQAGIPEYWLIEPHDKFIIVYTLNSEGFYVGSRPFTEGNILESSVLADFRLDVGKVFPQKP